MIRMFNRNYLLIQLLIGIFHNYYFNQLYAYMRTIGKTKRKETIGYAERVSERIVVCGTKEKGRKQERVGNMEAKNMPHGRTLTTICIHTFCDNQLMHNLPAVDGLNGSDCYVDAICFVFRLIIGRKLLPLVAYQPTI